MRHKTRFVPVAALVAMVLAVAGAAWACTVAANVAVSPESGPAGANVIVTGRTFGPAPVEIRWGGTEGQVLAIGQGPDFSIPVTIPAGSSPDVYYVVATQTNGGAVFKAAETIEVTQGQGSAGQGASVRAVSNDLWSGLDRSTSLNAETAASSSSNTRLPLGAGMAAVGVIGMAAVATFTTLRRRTTAAASKHRR